MKCPVCDGTMREVNKLGVDMDICPDCKGLWLDRGELEKIIQSVAGETGAPPPESTRGPRAGDRPDAPRPQDSDEHHDHDKSERPRESEHDRGGREHEPSREGRKRKESWLSTLGDMFGAGE